MFYGGFAFLVNKFQQLFSSKKIPIQLPKLNFKARKKFKPLISEVTEENSMSIFSLSNFGIHIICFLFSP